MPSLYRNRRKSMLMNCQWEVMKGKPSLRKVGNKILQWTLINIQSLFSMVTKRSCTIGAVVTSHGPYTHQGNAGNKKQKGRDSREILASQAVQGGNQLKEWCVLHKRNLIQPQELNRMNLKQEMTITSGISQTRTNAGRWRCPIAPRRYPGATINLQCPKLTHTTSEAYHLVNLCSHQFYILYVTTFHQWNQNIQVNKSTDTLLRSFNSRANSQQGKRRTNFIVKKFQYLQAISDEASRYHSSVEHVESSSSDNYEDLNKSTSIDSTEVGYSLTLQPWSHDDMDLQHVPKQAH